MVSALIFYGVLVAGLASMLIDGMGWLAAITYYGWMPLGALAVWRLNGGRLNDFVWQPCPKGVRHLSLGIVGGAGMVALIAAVFLGTGWATTTGLVWSTRQIALRLVIPQVLVAVFEELAFRGVMQPTLSTAWGPRGGLAGTAALFGLFHLPNIAFQGVPRDYVPLTVLTLMTMGVAFGLAFQLTRDHLALPTGLHLGWNLVAVGFEDGLAPDVAGPRWLVGTVEWFPESGLLGLLGLIVMSILVYRALSPRPGAGVGVL